jgi:hypothetical protein
MNDDVFYMGWNDGRVRRPVDFPNLADSIFKAGPPVDCCVRRNQSDTASVLSNAAHAGTRAPTGLTDYEDLHWR